MARIMFLVLILAMAGHSGATWCVCKEGLGDAALQKTLDYACGAGADCNPLHQNGPCFNPNTVKAHCNYAVNSYFQKKGQSQGSCDFSGTASVVTSDPSSAGCAYPTSASSVSTTPGTNTPTTATPITGTPSTGTPSTTTPNGGSPLVTTPSNGVLGGVGTGLGPSGAGNGINTDMSHGGFRIQKAGQFTLVMSMVISGGLVFLWG